MTTTEIQNAIEHEIGTAGSLKIHGVEGSIELRATDGASVRVQGSGERPLEDDFAIKRAPGALELSAIGEAVLGSSRLGRTCQAIVVEVPRVTRVRVATASGRIQATGLAGDQRYRTIAADIGIDAATGRIDTENVSGDTWIGAIGELSVGAQSVSGDLSIVASTIESLKTRTTSGSVWIEGAFLGAGPFAVETVSGDVTISPVGPVRVEGTTVSGDVRSELPHRSDGRPGRRSIELGEGGPLIGFRSLSGGLEVVAGQPTRVIEAISGHVPTTDAAVPDRSAEATDDLRLAILRDVESGAIDIDEAERRLTELDVPAQIARQTDQPGQIPQTDRPKPSADFEWVRRV
jgi:hypothetical protein